MITIHQRYRQKDRQTTCDSKTALCTKVHRAVKTRPGYESRNRCRWLDCGTCCTYVRRVRSAHCAPSRTDFLTFPPTNELVISSTWTHTVAIITVQIGDLTARKLIVSGMALGRLTGHADNDSYSPAAAVDTPLEADTDETVFLEANTGTSVRPQELLIMLLASHTMTTMLSVPAAVRHQLSTDICSGAVVTGQQATSIYRKTTRNW